MVNRKQTPELRSIDHIEFVKPQIFDITPWSKLFFMKEVPNETSRVDLYFNAGSVRGNVGIASIVNGLLLSGTDQLSSTEIHNQLDGLGAFYESNVGHENATISIYALKENMIQILHVLKNAIDKMALKSSLFSE